MLCLGSIVMDHVNFVIKGQFDISLSVKKQISSSSELLSNNSMFEGRL